MMNDRFKFRVWSDKQKKMYYWSDIIKMPSLKSELMQKNCYLDADKENIDQGVLICNL